MYTHVMLWNAAISQADRKKVADTIAGALRYLIGGEHMPLNNLGQ